MGLPISLHCLAPAAFSPVKIQLLGLSFLSADLGAWLDVPRGPHPPGESSSLCCVLLRGQPHSGPVSVWACRDRLLPQWIPLLAECPAITRMYEESALLRDRMTVNSLIRILQTIQDFTIVLEGSLIKGVDV